MHCWVCDPRCDTAARIAGQPGLVPTGTSTLPACVPLLPAVTRSRPPAPIRPNLHSHAPRRSHPTICPCTPLPHSLTHICFLALHAVPTSMPTHCVALTNPPPAPLTPHTLPLRSTRDSTCPCTALLPPTHAPRCPCPPTTAHPPTAASAPQHIAPTHPHAHAPRTQAPFCPPTRPPSPSPSQRAAADGRAALRRGVLVRGVQGARGGQGAHRAAGRGAAPRGGARGDHPAGRLGAGASWACRPLTLAAHAGLTSPPYPCPGCSGCLLPLHATI